MNRAADDDNDNDDKYNDQFPIKICFGSEHRTLVCISKRFIF